MVGAGAAWGELSLALLTVRAGDKESVPMGRISQQNPVNKVFLLPVLPSFASVSGINSLVPSKTQRGIQRMNLLLHC